MAGRLRRVRSGATRAGRAARWLLTPPPPGPTLDEAASAPPPPPPSATAVVEPSPLDAVLERQHEPGAAEPFGEPGSPVSRNHPFVLGFVGAIGVLVALGLVNVLMELSQVLTLLVVALFLALGLDPVVRALERRGLPRGAGVGLVFLGLVAVVAGFAASIVPIVVREATELAEQVPDYVLQVQQTAWFQRLDEEYSVVSRVTEEVQSRLTSGDTVATLFGGVLGAGRAVVGGVFSTLTVLVLALYFLASLETMKEAGYRLVPRSRRRRVRLLGDEITRRIGGYVLGQVAIATLNGLLSYVVLSLLDAPYAAVLALVVGVLGLIPLVGATLGAVVACVVVAFSSVTDALVLAAYYVVYQQVENYVIAPRVMSRTVSVPGAVAVVAALAGGSLLGIIGALIAIPIAAGVLLVVNEVWLPRQERS